MAINFAAASTAGLNNPGTEIITLVKDGSGNFINPPSYDKMRAYLSSGEVPMLFVTDEAGETGSLYQLVEYSETENKISFSNDKTTIAFSAGAAAPVVSDVVPKPLTYDYMPDGYPKKRVQTTTLMEEQAVEFADMNATSPVKFEISDGQTYFVVWDGVEYSCVGHGVSGGGYIGNPAGLGLEPTSEPFLYMVNGARYMWASYDAATRHTIGVKTITEVSTQMSENFLPVASEDNYGVVKKSEIVTSYKFPNNAPHDQMVEAITKFRKGIASIMWGGYLVASAEHIPSTDKITVRLADNPYRIRISENIEGHYSLLTTISEYERELFLQSDTIGSTKQFKITVDDSGTISATEVT